VNRTISKASAAVAACAALLLAGGGATANAATVGTAGSAGPAVAGLCNGGIRVNSFAFSPPAVTAGQGSAANLVITNCSGNAQSLTETWYGRFSGAGTGIPTGCPVLDPFLRTAVLAPHSVVSASTFYSTFAGCTATQLSVTVTITGPTGTVLAQPVAVLRIG
jgi:hypothetical protein